MAKLAIKGGNPIRTTQFPVWPISDKKELQALERVLKSGCWGILGSETQKFNRAFAQYQHCRYGLAVTNGTVSLEIILRALDIGRGDEVIMPPYTFNATASAVACLGGTPVFVDVEEDSCNLDPNQIEAAITPRTKAIMPVHIGGRPCNMDAIMAIAGKRHLYVVEDSAQAHGSEWAGQRTGSYGDAGSFSFQSSKNLTAGEGGAITTNNQALYERCWSIHNCGRDYVNPVWYDHPYVGTNARMTEWQAAVLNVQLAKLDEQIDIRMKHAQYLNARLQEIPCIRILSQDARITRNTIHLFIFRFIGEQCRNLEKKSFLDALSAEGIPCSSGYVPLYKFQMLQAPEFRRATGCTIDYQNMYLETAEKLSKNQVVWLNQNLLLGSKKDMDDIADAVVKVYENAAELL